MGKEAHFSFPVARPRGKLYVATPSGVSTSVHVSILFQRTHTLVWLGAVTPSPQCLRISGRPTQIHTKAFFNSPLGMALTPQGLLVVCDNPVRVSSRELDRWKIHSQHPRRQPYRRGIRIPALSDVRCFGCGGNLFIGSDRTAVRHYNAGQVHLHGFLLSDILA